MPAGSRKQADEIVILGYGAFGQLAARWLRTRFRVCITDVRPVRKPPRGITVLRFDEIFTRKIFILAVPISTLRTVLRSIAPRLPAGALVIDVCSVKELPSKWMMEILPRRVSVLGTHPLFGPSSAEKTLRGRPIVLCPLRLSGRKLERITGLLRGYGLNVVRMSPPDHDRLMASTLFYAHFLGRGMLRSGLLVTPLATPGYRSLVRTALGVGLDSPMLFRDMYRYNRFARSVPRRVIRDFGRVYAALVRKGRRGD